MFRQSRKQPPLVYLKHAININKHDIAFTRFYNKWHRTLITISDKYNKSGISELDNRQLLALTPSQHAHLINIYKEFYNARKTFASFVTLMEELDSHSINQLDVNHDYLVKKYHLTSLPCISLVIERAKSWMTELDELLENCDYLLGWEHIAQRNPDGTPQLAETDWIVAESQIPEAGLGLYTAAPLEQDSYVGDYPVSQPCLEEELELFQSYGNAYLLETTVTEPSGNEFDVMYNPHPDHLPAGAAPLHRANMLAYEDKETENVLTFNNAWFESFYPPHPVSPSAALSNGYVAPRIGMFVSSPLIPTTDEQKVEVFASYSENETYQRTYAALFGQGTQAYLERTQTPSDNSAMETSSNYPDSP